MDVALVERAQDDVDDADRDEEQQPQVVHRLLKDFGLSFVARRDGRGQQAVGHLLDVRGRSTQRHARLEPERHRHRRQLAGVVDRLRSDRLLEVDDRLQRHQRAARRLERDFFQRVDLPLMLRIELEQDAVLGGVAVDRRRPLRPERVVHRVLDRGRVQAYHRGLVAVDDDVDARASHLHVVGRILNLGHLRGDGRLEQRRPPIQLLGVEALHHDAEVLVAHAAADLQRRRQPDESAETGESQQLRPDLLRDLLRALVARRARRQLHKQIAAVRAAASSARTAAAGAAADAGLERVDVRVLDDDVGDLLHPLRHVVVRRALRRLQVDEQRIVVLIGNEPGRDDVRHPHGGAEHGDEDQQHRDPMAQHVAERPLVRMQQPVERAIHQAGKTALAVHDAEEPAAQHRRQGDGDDA